ncbi:MAG: DegV family protein [Anaerolineales bacterium]|nr:DegV family protein [Anaerolineales bacterium]
MKTAIVTDSTSDLNPDLLSAYQINLIPAILIMDGNSLQDGEDISRREFYERLPSMKEMPTTAAPSVGTFEELYHKLFEQGFNHIISIHVASTLSGIYNAAYSAARQFENKITVIDSAQVSMGLGFQVLAAAESALKALPLDQILHHLAKTRQRIRLVAMLDTLEYIRRSGRVSWMRASMGTFLNIKPFLGIEEGKVLRLGEARTRRKGIQRLAEILCELGNLSQLAILHTNAEEEATNLQEQFAAIVPKKPFLVNVTTVIGTHVGPNAVGFTAVVE